jgi:hypothetical protein
VFFLFEVVVLLFWHCRSFGFTFSGDFGVVSLGGGDASDGVGLICCKGVFISGCFWVVEVVVFVLTTLLVVMCCCRGDMVDVVRV